MNVIAETDRKTAHLQGELGCAIEILEVKRADKNFYHAKCLLQADWLSSCVAFEITKDRASEFISELNTLLEFGAGQVNLINEDGNLHLNFEVTKLGQVIIKCIVSKNMLDDSQVKLEVHSETISLTNFSKAFEGLFSR